MDESLATRANLVDDEMDENVWLQDPRTQNRCSSWKRREAREDWYFYFSSEPF